MTARPELLSWISARFSPLLSLPPSPRLNPRNSRPSIKILCSASLYFFFLFVCFFFPPLSFQPPSAASGLAGRPTTARAGGKNPRCPALNRWLRGLALDRVSLQCERRSCQGGESPLSSPFESPPPPLGGGSKPLLRVFCLRQFLAAALECFSEFELRLCQPSSRCPGSREGRRTTLQRERGS